MAIELQPETIVRAVRDQVSCNVENDAVILHVKQGRYYGLNEVGAVVWNRLQQPHSVGELRQIVMGEFEVGAEQCAQDLDELLRELLDAGLVEVEASDAA